MQRKTIRKVLSKKILAWTASITDEAVRAIALENAIVTGGSIASLLLNETVKDFDIYFRTKAAAEAVAKYYVGVFVKANPDYAAAVVQLEQIKNIKGEVEERVTIRIPSVGVAGENQDNEEDEPLGDKPEPEEKGEYRPMFLSENAITLSDKMQLVIRFYGEPDQIHSNYDFAHAMNWYRAHDDHLHLDPLALECLLSKTLIYKGSLYPICSIFRVRKFITRGWKISAGELLKIMWQISELNLKDITVLREQLTGVDALYFARLVEILEAADHDKLSSNYAAEIIDRVFQGE